MKISFDIKYRPQIESGEYKVVTGDDRPVRIISWDKKVFGGRTEIVGLVPTSQGDTETVQLYYPDGTLVASGWNENFKLFIVTPEPELTDWQTFISGCLQKHGLLDCGAADRIAKECSAELLELAKKEIGTTFDKAGEYLRGRNDGIEYGKAEALKDLPRWRVELRDIKYAAYGIIGGSITSKENPRVYLNGHSIDLYSLRKLPGFKED